MVMCKLPVWDMIMREGSPLTDDDEDNDDDDDDDDDNYGEYDDERKPLS